MSIDRMRKTYTLGGLKETDVDSAPLVQFQKWFDEAQLKGSSKEDVPDWLEANAMTLSTANADGAVSSRIVLLKGLTNTGFVFYSNYESTKGSQMESNPQVSLCFFWPHLERQVRIEGMVSKTSRSQSTAYFHSRPRDSQLGAIVSEQSSETTRDSLESRMIELQRKYADIEIPCPDYWGGYEVTPTQIEFWQGRPSRLHDRIVYRAVEDGWSISRIAP